MRRASTSRPTVGSSRKSRSGSPQIASANSTRCRWPPERSPNFRSLNFSSPAAARTSFRRHRLLVIAGKQIDVLAHPQRFRNSSHLQHGAGPHPVFRIRRVAAENTHFSGIGLHQSQQQASPPSFCRLRSAPAAPRLLPRAPENSLRAAPGRRRSSYSRLRDWPRLHPRPTGLGAVDVAPRLRSSCPPGSV